jgi:hypothetical protein
MLALGYAASSPGSRGFVGFCGNLCWHPTLHPGHLGLGPWVRFAIQEFYSGYFRPFGDGSCLPLCDMCGHGEDAREDGHSVGYDYFGLHPRRFGTVLSLGGAGFGSTWAFAAMSGSVP